MVTGLGCAQGSRNVAQLPIEERLRDAYPDLQAGRFVVIADFEDAGQAGQFRLQSASTSEAPVVQSTTAVEPTGGGCLVFTLGESRELVLDHRSETEEFFPSDWREYNLLLMNIALEQPATLELAIVTGVGESEARSVCLIPLEAGWNPIRLDLKEPGEQVSLHNVRELRWRILDAPSAVMLRLDDLVLANNRQELFGDSSAADGKLYVVREGRHTSVGAGGRFELGFLNGQIVRWYALDADPMRLTDLVGSGNVLGPVPVGVDAADLERQLRAGELPIGVGPADRMIAARQRVIEAHDARVTLECDWTPSTKGELNNAVASIRWTYTIYPTGDVYVTVASRGGREGAVPGLAVSRLPVPELTAHVEEPVGRSGACFGALGAPRSGCLLFVPRGAGAFPGMRVVRDPLRPRVSLLSLGPRADRALHAACLLALWPPTNCDAARQRMIAESYAHPPKIDFLIGDFDRGTDGDLDADGFNERFGAYALALHENRVHASLDGRKRPLHQPVFFVPGSAGKEVWVYVDHLVFSDLHRDGDQNVMFQLPYTIDRPMVIEVYARGGG